MIILSYRSVGTHSLHQIQKSIPCMQRDTPIVLLFTVLSWTVILTRSTGPYFDSTRACSPAPPPLSCIAPAKEKSR